jgi:hypothetical protein
MEIVKLRMSRYSLPLVPAELERAISGTISSTGSDETADRGIVIDHIDLHHGQILSMRKRR